MRSHPCQRRSAKGGKNRQALNRDISDIFSYGLSFFVALGPCKKSAKGPTEQVALTTAPLQAAFNIAVLHLGLCSNTIDSALFENCKPSKCLAELLGCVFGYLNVLLLAQFHAGRLGAGEPSLVLPVPGLDTHAPLLDKGAQTRPHWVSTLHACSLGP